MFKFEQSWRDNLHHFRETTDGSSFDVIVAWEEGVTWRQRTAIVSIPAAKYSPMASLYGAIRAKIYRHDLERVAADLRAIRDDRGFSGGWASGMTASGGWSDAWRRGAVLTIARALESVFPAFIVEHRGEDRWGGHDFELRIDDGIVEREYSARVVETNKIASSDSIRVYLTEKKDAIVGEVLKFLDNVYGETVDDATDILNREIESAEKRHDETRLQALHRVASAMIASFSTVSIVYEHGNDLFFPSWKSDFRLLYRI